MTKRLGLTLVAFVIWTTITVVGGILTTGGEGTLSEAVGAHVGWTFLVASAFILAVVLWQGWGDVGLNRGADAAGWRLTWLPMLYVVGGFGLATLLGLPPMSVLLLVLINTALVGFSEELMFRGVLLQGFRHRTTIWIAVLLTSVMFGAIHSLNVFVTGDLKGALLQSSAAFLSGLMFIALRLRTGSLWPPIILHGLWDFATFSLAMASASAASKGVATQTAEAAASGSWAPFFPIFLVLPNAIYGLWLMRNIGKTHATPEK